MEVVNPPSFARFFDDTYLYTGAARNYSGYSDPEFDKLVDKQSVEADPQKRKEIVWQIERKLAEAAVLATRDLLFDPSKYWDAANGRIRDGMNGALTVETWMGTAGSWQLRCA